MKLLLFPCYFFGLIMPFCLFVSFMDTVFCLSWIQCFVLLFDIESFFEVFFSSLCCQISFEYFHFPFWPMSYLNGSLFRYLVMHGCMLI
jgi:hypothetical protein